MDDQYDMLLRHRTELWRAVVEGQATEAMVLRQSEEWMVLLHKLEKEDLNMQRTRNR